MDRERVERLLATQLGVYGRCVCLADGGGIVRRLELRRRVFNVR